VIARPTETRAQGESAYRSRSDSNLSSRRGLVASLVRPVEYDTLSSLKSLQNDMSNLQREVTDLKEREERYISFNSLVFGGVCLLFAALGAVVSVVTVVYGIHQRRQVDGREQEEIHILDEGWEQVRRRLILMGEVLLEGSSNYNPAHKLKFRACMNTLSRESRIVRGALQHLRQKPEANAIGLVYSATAYWSREAKLAKTTSRRSEAQAVLNDIAKTLESLTEYCLQSPPGPPSSI